MVELLNAQVGAKKMPAVQTAGTQMSENKKSYQSVQF
jgi:hypothetical protein